MAISYLRQKPSGHYFRYQIPKDIKPFNIDELNKNLKANEFHKKLLQTTLITNKKMFNETYFKDLLRKNGITEFDPESFEYKKLCREVVKAHPDIRYNSKKG